MIEFISLKDLSRAQKLLVAQSVKQDERLLRTWGINNNKISPGNFYENLYAWKKENKGEVWLIFSQAKLIGGMGISRFHDGGGSGTPRLAFYLLSEYWGRGCSLQVAQKAVQLAAEVGCNQLLYYASKDQHSGKTAFYQLGASIAQEDKRGIQFVLNF